MTNLVTSTKFVISKKYRPDAFVLRRANTRFTPTNDHSLTTNLPHISHLETENRQLKTEERQESSIFLAG
jgi:hypothetical protein